MSCFRTLFGLCWLMLSIAAQTTQQNRPVYLFLYARIDNHVTPWIAEERIDRLLPALAQMNERYPQYHVSAVFQFSGAMVQALDTPGRGRMSIEKVKDYRRRGIIEIGYAGENEPTFRNRPRPDLKHAQSADERWLARGDAAERFLVEAKDPVRGDLDSNRAGGIKSVQQVFGDVDLITGTTEKLGGDAPIIHRLRKLDVSALQFGLPDPDPARGIHGYRGSVEHFGHYLSPEPNTSPELYWEDNVLRSSDTSSPALHVISASEGPNAFRTLFNKLDRSRIHIVHVEYGDYNRYLNTWHDGVPRFSPLVWAYDHPDDPEVPSGVPAFADRVRTDDAYRREVATLKWLVEDFLNANQGSRFVSCSDLRRMAGTSVGEEISAQTLKAAASDLLSRYVGLGNYPPNFARAGGQYFSLADMFELLAKGVTESRAKTQAPQASRLVDVYGPLEMVENQGTPSEVTRAEIVRAATAASNRLEQTTWKPVPSNSIPILIQVGNSRVNAAQFLRLLAESYLAPLSNTRFAVQTCNIFSPAGEVFPRMIERRDQGDIWTFRPAPLGGDSSRHLTLAGGRR